MSNPIRRTVALLAAVLMFSTVFASAASANTISQGDAANASPVVDVLVLRPVGFVSLIVGSTLFLATAPIVLVTRPTDIDKPFKQLVVRPAKYLWVDPLGGH